MSMNAFYGIVLEKANKTFTLQTIYNVTYSPYKRIFVDLFLWNVIAYLQVVVITDVFTFKNKKRLAKYIMYQNFGWCRPNCAVMHSNEFLNIV